MRALRLVHAIAAVLAGLALAGLIYGWLRLAVALLVIVILLLVGSLELLRTTTIQRETRR